MYARHLTLSLVFHSTVFRVITSSRAYRDLFQYITRYSPYLTLQPVISFISPLATKIRILHVVGVSLGGCEERHYKVETCKSR